MVFIALAPRELSGWESESQAPYVSRPADRSGPAEPHPAIRIRRVKADTAV
jgi:hypothetical protein